MRESNFSNPAQNKACICISAAIYDRRAIDCTATLPLINSLNHLAYLTSTSPRIREMVCVDGGLERLIRILGQVPRSPSPPAVRGVITSEMQAVWKWSLAFQCVVNIGVRGSENVRTRVVEAGMVPVAVRVLESYLKVADALREERKREARREDARQRLERAAESVVTSVTEASTPTVAHASRQHLDIMTPQASHSRITGAIPALTGQDRSVQMTSSDTLRAPQHRATDVDPVLSILPDGSSANPHATLAPILTSLAPVTLDTSVSPSSSASSIAAGEASRPSSSRAVWQEGVPGSQMTGSAATSSVEDHSTSGSGSDGAEDAEMREARSTRTGQSGNDSPDSRTTPRPPRRLLNATVVPAAQPTPMQPFGAQGRLARADLERARREQSRQRNETQPALARNADRRHNERSEHASSRARLNVNDMIYREEEVLLSLQLLAYLSKYAHVRTLFHRDLATFDALDPLDSVDGAGPGSYSKVSNRSWSPSDPVKKNVFCIAERYTLRSSRTGLSHFATLVESRIAPEIQYWAGVIMRNACRKDEKSGGIRQCANMLCGKWEEQPREFAKCRRCRKAKYCSKQCQSKGWQMGHRFWCSARNDDEQPEGGKERAQEAEATDDARTVTGTEYDAMHVRGAESDSVRAESRSSLRSDPHDTREMTSDAESIPAPGSGTSRSVSPNSQSMFWSQGDNEATSAFTVRRQPDASTTQRANASDGRRIPSAIPQHLQPADSSRSRTTSAASSSADISDMSDDEMERAAHRRLTQTTLHRNPSQAHLTPLSHVVIGDESDTTNNDEGRGEVPTRNRPMRQRTDLAGRPLPPPVIAQHDGSASMNLTSDGELMTLGDHMDATTANEAEAAVFGRGDFDQMLWRGRTPSREEQEVTRQLERVQQRAESSTPSSRPGSALERSGDEGSASDADVNSPGPNADHVASRIRHGPTPSMLNTALLLAGDDHVHGLRHPSSSSLRSPRQQQRYASMGTSSSVSSGLADLAAMSPVSPTRSTFHHPSLADTLIDWSSMPPATSLPIPSTPTASTNASETTPSQHRASLSMSSNSAQTPRQRPVDVSTLHALSAIDALPPLAHREGAAPLVQAMRSPTGLHTLGDAAPGDLRGLFTAANVHPEGDIEMRM